MQNTLTQLSRTRSTPTREYTRKMVVGILQVELAIPGALSLKDKRSVVRSVKDRLHQNHQVSVAEVGRLDDITTALIGITLAASSVPHCDSVLDTILAKLSRERDCFIADSDKQILTGQPCDPNEPTLADIENDAEMDQDPE